MGVAIKDSLDIRFREKGESGDVSIKRKRPRPYSFSFRNYIQLGIFIITIAMGFQFFLYVHSLQAGKDLMIPHPPGVEGFLPIGALMGWKYFILTGIWDPIHPASMVILGFAVFISVLFRKSFCGWFCPVGTLSEWLWKLGRKWLGRNYLIPKWLDYPLRSLKYLLLIFFLSAVISMDKEALFQFLSSPYYRMSDVKMLHFFTKMSMFTAVVLFVLSLLSLLYRNFWCRYLCPYGGFVGILAVLSPTRIVRNSDSCTDCGLCTKVCPHRLPVDKKTQIISPECCGCMDCVLVCPVRDTLEMKSVGIKQTWTVKNLGLAIVLFFVLTVYMARITGHWKSAVTDHEYQMRLKQIETPVYQHPGGG